MKFGVEIGLCPHNQDNGDSDGLSGLHLLFVRATHWQISRLNILEACVSDFSNVLAIPNEQMHWTGTDFGLHT